MDQDALVQRLMATFAGELEDHVRTLERDLLALEKTSAPDAREALFSTLFRTSHSLKGAARSVKVDLIEDASHLLEEIFGAARGGSLPVDAEFFELLLPVVDAIGEAGTRLRSDRDLSQTRLQQMVGVLTTLLPRGDGYELPPPPAPLTPRASTRVVAIPREPDAPPPAAPAHATQPVEDRWRGMVRVPAEKLDALLSQSSELLLVRHRTSARGEGLALLQDWMSDARKDWRRIEQGLAGFAKANASEPSAADGARTSASLLNKIEHAGSRHKDTLSRLERGLQRLAGELALDLRMLDLTATPLDAEIRRTRMLPFAEACEGLDRMVRDLTASGGKQVMLAIEGGEIELDRSVLEGLRDPLNHLVRNAVDHGIETVAVRGDAGKAAVGRVCVSASLVGGQVEIRVEDDGKGLDLAAIRERLRRQARPIPEDDRELIEQIFVQGMSTSPVVTQVSGRGVGLDVVKSRLAAMRGNVNVSCEPYRGTCFTLRVPLTLTTLRAILIGLAGQAYAIDTTSVHRVLAVAASDVKAVEGRDVIIFDGAPVPLAALSEVLGGDRRTESDAGSRLLVVVLKAADRLAGFVVDELQGEQEIVIRSLGSRLSGVAGTGGATILPSGKIALILNAPELVTGSLKLSPATSLVGVSTQAPRSAKKRLLVVDDSVTVRTLEKSILEAAGYEVTLAVDGAHAWQLLLEQGADLVVSDIDMPQMDGFALTEAIRGSRRFRSLPVVLVTAKESDADKARGLAVGADAYQLKSAFDQRDLLVTIQQIL